jgi:hypothetical protein
MPTRYFYLRETQQQGPIDETELRRLIDAGTVRPETLVWREGAPDWVAARSISELFPGEAHAAPPPLTPPRSAAGSAAADWGRAVAREAGETARVTASQIGRLIGLGSARWDDHRLARKAVDAQAEFGLRLFEGGLGDEELRSRLVQLDEQITGLEWTKASTREVEAERRGVLVRLAEPYLNASPPAGMELEYERARAALLAEQQAHERAARERAGLLPGDDLQRRRLAIGAAVILLGVLLLGWLVCGGSWSSGMGDDEHSSRLVGEWSGTTKGATTFTTRLEFEPDGRVLWHQDSEEGAGTWRVKRVDGVRYTLEVLNDVQPDRKWAWVMAFNGDDEFTITGFDTVPITVQRQK